MTEPASKVYWDSCAWIGLVNAEPKKIHPLRHIWEEAKKGKFEIWTSSYTYLEVFKAKSDSGDPLSVNESIVRIEALLQQPYVRRVQVDTPIAKLARDLRLELGKHGLKSRPDAVHLATASYWNLQEFHTWDAKHLLVLDGLVYRRDGQKLVIRIPGPEVMGPLFGTMAEHGTVGSNGELTAGHQHASAQSEKS